MYTSGKYKARRGHNLILLIGIFLLVLMSSVLSIDMAFYFTAQNQLRTASDAASLAATDELFQSDGETPGERQTDALLAAIDLVEENLQEGVSVAAEDVVFGFIDPNTMEYNADTFSVPSGDPAYDATGGYNAVRVAVQRAEGSINTPLPTIMANILGIGQMNTLAVSTAVMEQNNQISSVTNGGLRPIYSCEAQVIAAFADGDPTDQTARIYGDHFELDGDSFAGDCPAPGSGNWGFADFTDCSSGTVGASTIADWFEFGYPGTVNVDECYSTKPGNFISGAGIPNILDNLIATQTVIMLPVNNTFNGNGSNTSVDISGFVGFVVTGYRSNGPASGRYIEGYYTDYICAQGCTSDEATAPSIGASIVDLRLAPMSN